MATLLITTSAPEERDESKYARFAASWLNAKEAKRSGFAGLPSAGNVYPA
jgi:hypothetical protein